MGDLRAAAVLPLVFAVALSGCTTSSKTQSSSTPAPGASGTAGTIRIGIDLPVSGADASVGIPTQNGAVMAIEEAARAGLPGGFTLVASTLDDAVQGVHDPAQGAQNVKTFIADATVLGIVGPYNSNVAKAEIPLTNDAQIVQVSPATTAVGLTKGPDAAALRASHPDSVAYFRVCSTDDWQGAADARYVRRLGLHKAFVIDDDETYGKGLADIFEREFASAGGTILGHEHLTRGQQDFKALLTKVHAQNPDVVFFGGTTASGGGLLRRQMGDVGMRDVPFAGGDGIADDEFIHTAGTMADNTYFTVAAPDVLKMPSARSFVAAYQKRWNAPIGPYSANAYAAAAIEIAAIRSAIAAAKGAMPTRDAVLKAVAATKGFDSPIGPITFNKDGDRTGGAMSLYKIQGGKTVFVNQITVGT